MLTFIPRERVVTNNQGSPGDTLLVLNHQAPPSKILAVPNSLIAADVTAAMLVERTIAKKSFGDLTLLLNYLLCKP